MKVNINNIEETKLLACILADNIKKKGGFIALLGEIGAGKTAFTRYLIKHLNVKEEVTSPSFVILNEYKTDFLPVYHFDLYRLESSGLDSMKEELREYSKENVLTLVEWANFGESELPFDKMSIEITYDIENYSEKRIFNFEGTNEYYIDVIKKTIESFEHKRG